MKCTEGRTLVGPAGGAMEVLYEWAEGDPPDVQGTVAVWYLHCPGQSPAWDRYILAVVHLRPIPGVRPAVVNVPHATHEVLVHALDPQRMPTALDPATWAPLRPLNVVEQLQLPDDDAAREVAALAARAVVDGVLPAEPPLSGQVEPWRTALLKTAAHLRGEEHAP